MKHQGRFVAGVAVLAAIVIAVPLAAAGLSSPAARTKAAGRQVVGYFIEWGIYGRNYTVKNVKTSGSADKLTVINYAFGNVAPDGNGDVVCKLADDWADVETLQAHRAARDELQTMLARWEELFERQAQ